MGPKRIPRNDKAQNVSSEGLISDRIKKGNLPHITEKKSHLLSDRG